MILQAPYLIWLIPLVGALLIYIVRDWHRHLSTLLMLLSMIPSVILAWALIPDALSGKVTDLQSGTTIATSLPHDHVIYDFLVMHDQQGNKVLELSMGMIIDPLTIFMLVIITTIGFLILIYSIEYMNHESPSEYGRFWTWMLMFIAAMTLLVSADNLIILFFAWEFVGLCSWQLISFWNSSTKPSPDPRFATEGEYNAHCGLKAFIMTSVGDVFLLIAIGLTTWSTFEATGRIELNLLKLGEDVSWLVQLGNAGLLTVTALFFFLGAVGKSAQFPLHEWLPEAMAGPSPVSALIHAATMVKAGVYLVARMSPIFHAGMQNTHLQPDLSLYFMIVAVTGGFTAFLAATQALVAKEIKKVLAYSTISQIGYMMLILGTIGLLSEDHVADAYLAGLYHLMAHAVFKALLFLAAGVILHQIGVKTMEKMGGLKDKMPMTFLVLTIGAASLAGIPPLSGFYSKEHILVTLLEGQLWWLFGFAGITAILTVFYSFRMIGLVFFGPKSEYILQLERTESSRVRDPSFVMIAPLVILSIFVVLLGPLGGIVQDLLRYDAILLVSQHPTDYIGFMITPLLSMDFLLSVLIILLGFVPAYLLYIKRSISPEKIVESTILLKKIHQFLWNRWYLNKIYYFLFVDVLKSLSERLRSIQTGRLSVNMNYSLLGLLLIFVIGGVYLLFFGGA